ncbi:DUF6427 family protein [Winogradskyella sp. UBA3174]|uniref:DUF6427 family protein n=1 Tax=Winogradskyella sp. UBA3174 TaxID=1947785 RepID=UPI0025E80C77|nr:DUF6427 family protein [Winogradskyella sp. UBA3174]|tara:strand:+ start:80317 stop:81234 length:918 start_codon:yes stop_codon:yes gene_type:complete
MITSIFSKSKPINIIIVLVFVGLLFVISNYTTVFINFNSSLSGLAKLVIALFSVFLSDFIISKNSLTKKNSYAIMTFGLLFALFPEALKYSDLLLSNLFILFALRRIISLHTRVNVKKKLFDAAFWIAMATLFYFLAILFFAILIVALIYHSQNDVKNTIVPLTGVITVAVLMLSYNIIFYDVFFKDSNFNLSVSIDYTAYNSTESIIKLTTIFVAFIWIVVYFFKNLGDKNKKIRPSYFLIAWSAIIAILIAIISPVKNGSEFLFLFAPFSIIMANYIEVITERWFKELFVSIFIIIPLVSLVL